MKKGRAPKLATSAPFEEKENDCRHDSNSVVFVNLNFQEIITGIFSCEKSKKETEKATRG